MLINSNIKISYFVPGISKNSKDIGVSIRGQVKALGVTIPCRVRLYEKISGQLIADIKTDEQGVYEFKQLLEKKYFLVAHHPASQYNAVIQDNVVPV